MRGLRTLGVKNQQKKDGLGDGHETPLSEAEVHSFRSTAARANYLAIWHLANKKLCRRMSAPTRAGRSACPDICCQAPPGERGYVAIWREHGCLCGHGFRGVSGHSAEQREERAPHQKLELDAEGSDVELTKQNCVESSSATRKRLGSRVLAATLA